MADTLTTPNDLRRIDIDDTANVQYWTHTLGVSAEQLRELVEQYGEETTKIREVIGR